MRILYDSKQLQYKSPFGTLTPGQSCTLNIHIPVNVEATTVTCIICYDGGTIARNADLKKSAQKGPYEIFSGEFSLEYTGIYFYYFYIDTPFNLHGFAVNSYPNILFLGASNRNVNGY